jgi:hypothetical protein
MQKAMLNIVPEKLKIDFVRTNTLSTMVAVFSFECIITVFTDFGHINLFFEAGKDNKDTKVKSGKPCLIF